MMLQKNNNMLETIKKQDHDVDDFVVAVTMDINDDDDDDDDVEDGDVFAGDVND